MELQEVESMPGATLHWRTRIWIRSLLEMVSGLQPARHTARRVMGILSLSRYGS